MMFPHRLKIIAMNTLPIKMFYCYYIQWFSELLLTCASCSQAPQANNVGMLGLISEICHVLESLSFKSSHSPVNVVKW